MYWNTVLKDDQLIPSTVYYRFSDKEPLREFYTSQSNLGEYCQTHCNRGSNWKMGNHSFLPPKAIIHFRNKGECTPSRARVYQRDYLGKSWMSGELVGPLASCFEAYSNARVYEAILPVDNSALSALVSAVAKSKDAAVDAGLMLAEAGETLALLASPLRGLRSLMKLLDPYKASGRKGLIKGSRAFADYVTSAWLQYRYGIMPLLSDVDSIRRAVHEGLTRQLRLRKSHSNIVIPGIPQDRVLEGVSGPPGFYGWGSSRMVTNQIVRATAYYRVVGRSLESQLGVDANNLPSFLWELLPYSFVVDWFVDVGSWLKAIKPEPSISHLGNCLSTETQWKYTVNITHVNRVRTLVDPLYPGGATGSTFEFVKSAYSRNVGVSLPALPQVNPSLLSFKRKVDAVSLIWGSIKTPQRVHW